MATAERLIIESMFRIADKDGNDVDFKLNREQALLDTFLTNRNRVPKARQLGISSYVLANFTAKCLHKRNTRAVVISHDEKSTEKMFSKVHYFLDNIRGPKAITKTASRNMLSFPKTGSVFYVGTAGARKFGRGDTITDLHCSEIAYWPDPKSLTKGLYQAVPRSGTIIEESTGNGVGNYFHRNSIRSYEGKTRWKLHFFNWLNFSEYAIPLTEEEKHEVMLSLSDEFQEPEMLKRGLTLEQIAWRREKIEELDSDLREFKQEYPITLDECFQSTGFSLFQNVKYEPRDDWTRISPQLWMLDDEFKLARDNLYTIGADVSGGVGRDRSVAQIINITRNEQVGEWVADNCPPDVFALKLKSLGEQLNNAFITVESNNHGGSTLTVLKNVYPKYLIFSQKKETDQYLQYGFNTTSKTKPLILNNLRKEFTDGFVIHSPALKDELGTFVEKDTGKLEAEEGCFDDRVMALAVGLMGAQKAHLSANLQTAVKLTRSRNYDPSNMDAIIAELEARRGSSGKGDNLPIPFQHLEH